MFKSRNRPMALLCLPALLLSSLALDPAFGATKKVKVPAKRAVTPAPAAVRVARPAKTSPFKMTRKRRALVAANGILLLSTFATLANQWSAASDYKTLYDNIDGTTDLNQARLYAEKNKVDGRVDVVMAVSLVTLASLTYTALIWKDAGKSDPPRASPVSMGLSPRGFVVAARVSF